MQYSTQIDDLQKRKIEKQQPMISTISEGEEYKRINIKIKGK